VEGGAAHAGGSFAGAPVQRRCQVTAPLKNHGGAVGRQHYIISLFTCAGTYCERARAGRSAVKGCAPERPGPVALSVVVRDTGVITDGGRDRAAGRAGRDTVTVETSQEVIGAGPGFIAVITDTDGVSGPYISVADLEPERHGFPLAISRVVLVQVAVLPLCVNISPLRYSELGRLSVHLPKRGRVAVAREERQHAGRQKDKECACHTGPDPERSSFSRHGRPPFVTTLIEHLACLHPISAGHRLHE